MILGLSRSKGPSKAFSFPVSFSSAGRAEARGEGRRGGQEGRWGKAANPSLGFHSSVL